MVRNQSWTNQVHLHSFISWVSPLKLSSFYSFTLPPQSPIPCPIPTYHSQYPHWSCWILTFILCCWFSCTGSWRYLAVLMLALWQLRDSAGLYHTSWAAKGEKKEWGKKQSGQSQIAFSYHKGIQSHRVSVFPFYPFLSFPAPRRTTLEKKTKRRNLASFPPPPHYIFNLPSTHMHKHPHCCDHAVLPCVTFHFLFWNFCYFLWFLVICWVNRKETLVERFNLIFCCWA